MRNMFLALAFVFLQTLSVAWAEEPPVEFTSALARAEQCDAQAQYDVGSFYSWGEVVEQDFSKVLFWYEKAAAQNHTLAEYGLGMIYVRGEGVVEDFQKARELLTLAADKNSAEAQYDLAVFYDEGKGGAEDNPRAGELYLKAAQQGHASAMNNFAFMLRDGEIKLKGASQTHWARQPLLTAVCFDRSVMLHLTFLRLSSMT